MQRTRSFTPQRIAGMGFIVIVLCVIGVIYFSFVFVTWLPHVPCSHVTLKVNPESAPVQPVTRNLQGMVEDCIVNNTTIIAYVLLVLFHFFFVNLMLALYQSVMTDPGVVPPNWGFYMGDETKRRRYCKMCNVWKPDRTHHCSICNRCNLNMDHHCPWINNCVGFYNRKFFMQLLFYVYLALVLVVFTTIPDLIDKIKLLIADVHNVNASIILQFIAYFFSLLLLGSLTNFTRFHVKLVADNYTTIENLERDEGARSKFDIGSRRNWEQVFGPNPLLWWLPMHTVASRPVGDGVRWRVHYTRVIDEDEEIPGDEAVPGRQDMPSNSLLKAGN